MRLVAITLGLILLTVSPVRAVELPAKWKAEWPKTEFSKSIIDFGEVISGGPPKDGIPAIDEPRFRFVSSVTDIGKNEPVIVLRSEESAKAYPLRVLMWHEIANDEIGNTPVTVTYCPLCNTAIVFDRRVNGRVLDFGVSGKLRHSDMIMYDRQTESWWQQFTGTGIVGEYAGVQLKVLPSVIWPYAKFAGTYPQGLVLVPNNKRARKYGMNPYTHYDSSKRPFLYRGEFDENIPALAYVVAVGDQAWPLADLREAKEISADPLQLLWNEGMNSALDTSRISVGRDIGFVEVFDHRSPEPQAVPFVMTFAFAFRAFYPEGVIHGAGKHQ